MQVAETGLSGVLTLRPRRFVDPRGWFAETWNRETFRAAGIDVDFVQDNLSHSSASGTVRALHYQRAPMAQAKLVQVIKGRILDVVVDLRRQSATFGRHMAVELCADDGAMLFVPKGFAHGFCTLEPDAVVAYKVDAFHAPAHEGAIHWQDPDLAIAWPVSAAAATLSERDSQAGPFAGIDHGF